MVWIALVEPEGEENVGMVARVIKNFELDGLILVNPKCEISEKAYSRAMGGKEILERAIYLKDFDELRKKYEILIATSGKLGGKRNIRRIYIKPDELENLDEKTVIVFGRERNGLLNEEIDKCDLFLHIPAGKYSILNLSHAVAIVCYEIFKKRNKKEIKLADREIKGIMENTDKILKYLDIGKNRKKWIKIVLKRILIRAKLRKKEAYVLAGFFRKIFRRLECGE